MYKIVILIALLMLEGCGLIPVHKIDIEQGNIITEDALHRIHPGMSEADVKGILGSPMLMNTFADDRIDYVYTFKPAYSKQSEKYVTLTFKNHRLKDIGGNMYSQFIIH